MGDVHTKTIEGFWSLIKTGIQGVYHSVGRHYLQSYLNEYCFRYTGVSMCSRCFLASCSKSKSATRLCATLRAFQNRSDSDSVVTEERGRRIIRGDMDNDPNFGELPHLMPNYGTICQNCKRRILFWRGLPILPEDSGVTTYIAVSCQHPECGWQGDVRGLDVFLTHPRCKRCQ